MSKPLTLIASPKKDKERIMKIIFLLEQSQHPTNTFSSKKLESDNYTEEHDLIQF